MGWGGGIKGLVRFGGWMSSASSECASTVRYMDKAAFDAVSASGARLPHATYVLPKSLRTLMRRPLAEVVVFERAGKTAFGRRLTGVVEKPSFDDQDEKPRPNVRVFQCFTTPKEVA
jgi:hypothetical protein